jgi:hypothetical protein
MKGVCKRWLFASSLKKSCAQRIIANINKAAEDIVMTYRPDDGGSKHL